MDEERWKVVWMEVAGYDILTTNWISNANAEGEIGAGSFLILCYHYNRDILYNYGVCMCD